MLDALQPLVAPQSMVHTPASHPPVQAAGHGPPGGVDAGPQAVAEPELAEQEHAASWHTRSKPELPAESMLQVPPLPQDRFEELPQSPSQVTSHTAASPHLMSVPTHDPEPSHAIVHA